MKTVLPSPANKPFNQKWHSETIIIWKNLNKSELESEETFRFETLYAVRCRMPAQSRIDYLPVNPIGWVAERGSLQPNRMRANYE